MTATDLPADEGRPPWTVLAYVPITIAWTLAFRLTGGIDVPLVVTLVALAVNVALGYGMYRRHKAAWVVALILMVLPVVGLPNAFAGGFNRGLLHLAGVIAVLYVLLHPDTRRWSSQVRRATGHRDGSSEPYGTNRAANEQARRHGRWG